MTMNAEPEYLLYEFEWSHYCNKVSMALDYKGIKYRAVPIDVLGGPIKYTAISDLWILNI